MDSEVTFFKDILGMLIQVMSGLWTLNLSVCVAAIGWGVSSRSWRRGLSAPICGVAILTLAAFFTLNLVSLNRYYVRFEEAAQQLRDAWVREGRVGDIHLIFASLGTITQTNMGPPVAPYLAYVLGIEIIVAIGVGVMLSNLGRQEIAR